MHFNCWHCSIRNCILYKSCPVLSVTVTASVGGGSDELVNCNITDITLHIITYLYLSTNGGQGGGMSEL